SNMVFLNSTDILVLEKNNGQVRLVRDGTIQQEPVLDVTVSTEDESGLLGIDVFKDSSSGSNKSYAFVYFTEAQGEVEKKGLVEIGNRLYKYEISQNNSGKTKLINPELVLSVPPSPGTRHSGGMVLIGPDDSLYVAIGDLEDHLTYTQNVETGRAFENSSVIFRLDKDGNPAADGPFNTSKVLRGVYAYGIRNSFGMDFDPLTGKLWDSENGPGFGDEINLVESGFNSGWNKLQGFWSADTYFGGKYLPIDKAHESDLVQLSENSTYSHPEFAWNQTVGVTAIRFVDGGRLGENYQYDLFAADINNGNIYHFDLTNDSNNTINNNEANNNRDSLLLNGRLSDKIANTTAESNEAVFATGFAGVTDLEVGPDGYMYILTFHKSQGSIYRIVPNI
ncbi:MAG TPA: PQQ-dependent sugar dehydrogenase, partial [Nitrososphaeraceae archaeon]|nr:PQQ-dependent sugar dehydrogenase [Nitrososphaeraceae archaeon]